MATRKRVRATLEQQAIIHFEQLRKDLQRLREAMDEMRDDLLRTLDKGFDGVEARIDAVIAAARGEPRPPWAPPNRFDTKAHQLGNEWEPTSSAPPQSDRRP